MHDARDVSLGKHFFIIFFKITSPYLRDIMYTYYIDTSTVLFIAH